MKLSLEDKAYSGILFALNYCRFWLKAGNSHDIHPPFLYQLYSGVIQSKLLDSLVNPALDYRKSMLSDKTPIRYMPFGTASGKEKVAAVSEIARLQSVSLKTGMLLHKLVQYFRPATLLELGTNLGIGTVFMAAGNSGKVITLEGSPELLEVVNQRFKTFQLQGIEFVQGSFSEKLPMVIQSVDTLDFVFFDGDHKLQSTLEYFELCYRKANNNSVFVFDDIHWSPGMEKAWDMIVNDPRVTLAVDLYFCGIVFFRKELSKQFFCLRF
ncbi:MAG: O-methyltransferase [Bacteroidales bacterium]